MWWERRVSSTEKWPMYLFFFRFKSWIIQKTTA
jgi:hypothetical protein